jgi:hypothetical protein
LLAAATTDSTHRRCEGARAAPNRANGAGVSSGALDRASVIFDALGAPAAEFDFVRALFRSRSDTSLEVQLRSFSVVLKASFMKS